MGTVDSDVVVTSSWARWSWAAAHVLLASAVVGAVLSWAGVLIVVGSTVVPFWAAALVLLSAWTVHRVALSVWHVSRPRPARGWRLLLRVLTASAWVLVPLTAAAGGFAAPSYAVVEPVGSEGCRAVVTERSFFMSGSGTVHVAGGWGPFAPQVGSYRTDDAFRPVSAGAFSVSWDARFGGLLEVDGTIPGADDGSGSGLFAFDC